MNKFTPETNTQRRSLLKGVAVAGAVLGTGVTTTRALADTTVDHTAPVEPRGYRETEHIRTYYRSARF